MKDFRVMYQFLEPSGKPQFDFTTVLADDEGEAAAVIESKYADDFSFAIVQIVESNNESTGFSDDEIEFAIHQGALRERARLEIESPLFVEAVEETDLDNG